MQCFLIVNIHKHNLLSLTPKNVRHAGNALNNCSNQVINKIDLPWHKHALIVEPDSCTGCLNCVSICQYNAYSISDEVNSTLQQ